jgi:O-antigen ligase
MAFCFWFLWFGRRVFGLWLFGHHPTAAWVFSGLVGPVFLALVLVSSRRSKFTPQAPTKWILAWIAWALLSLLWTSGRLPPSGFDLVCLAATAAAVVLMPTDSRQWMVGMVAGAYCNAIFVFLAYRSGFSLRPMMETDYNPNLLAYEIAAGALCCVFAWLHSERKWLWALISAPLVVSLLLSTSKTAGLAFGITAILFVALSRRLAARTRVLILGCMLLVGVLTLPLIRDYLAFYLLTPNLLTLTGRVPLWMDAWDAIPRHWLVGYGFNSFRSTVPTTWSADHAHNEFLEQWITLGGVGLILTTGAYWSLLNRLRRSASVFAQLGLMWWVFSVLRGLIEADTYDLAFPVALMVFTAQIVAAEMGTKDRLAPHPQVPPPRGSGSLAATRTGASGSPHPSPAPTLTAPEPFLPGRQTVLQRPI